MSKESVSTTKEIKEAATTDNQPAVNSNVKSYEVLYEKEKQKSTIFLILTVALTILFFGSLAWGIAEANDNHRPQFMNDGQKAEYFEQRMGSKSKDYNAPMQQRGDRMMNMNFERFLNSDGTVNTNEINDFLSNLPQTAKENLQNKLNDKLDQAVKDGKITQDQANALKNDIINR